MAEKCDTKRTKPNISPQRRTSRAQQRFLDAYAELRQIRAAAEKIGIHRATIYRWRADPAFVSAMASAWRAGYDLWYRTVYVPRQAEQRAAAAGRRQAGR